MDKQIIQQLYEKYGSKIQLYLYALCNDFAAAEDLTQETFLKAMLALPKDHNNIGAWLYTVARRLCLNRMKREKRESPSQDVEHSLDASGSKIKETETEGLSAVLAKERSSLLYQGISSLDQSKREVLVMQYFSGLSIREIAQITGKTEANVKVLSHRGKRELRQFLEVNGYEI